MVGTQVAMRWTDGTEAFFPSEFLREESPSAENKGEVDILGHRHGGDGPTKFPGVTVVGWEFTGNYAIRFSFSDGHNSGLYTWDFLWDLKNQLET